MAALPQSRRVLVYRERVLNGSETFIRNQLDAMKRWFPLLVGLERRVSPLTRSSDIVLFPGPGRVRIRAFKVARFSFKLNRIFRNLRPQLVHAHFGMDAACILPTVKRYKLPLIVTLHGYDVNRMPHDSSFMARLYQRRLPELFEYADRIIVNSEYLRTKVIQLGCEESKLIILPPGVNELETNVVPPSARNGVLFVGRFVEHKGITDLITAYEALPESVKDEHPLVLIGDGDLMPEVQRLVNHMQSSVTVLGSQPPEVVAQHMRDAAIFVGPSKPLNDGTSEALGVVFLEAQNAETPVVAYRTGGIPDAVVDGETGLLLDPGDIQALGHAMHRLLQDSELRGQMGSAGREHVHAQFSLEKNTARLEQLYDRVLMEASADA